MRAWIPLAALLLLVVGCAPATTASGDTAIAPAAAAPAATVLVRDAPPAPVRPTDRLAPSRPEALAVPALGISTDGLLDLGIDEGGALEVPPDAATAGWFTLGPTPGAPGPAVIAAHVDYAGEPGLFAQLDTLVAGEEVAVRRADGSEAVFTTYRVERFPKAEFPTQDVYGDTPGAELRLITCGGVFDRGTGEYADNVVVYARLTGQR